MGQFSDFVIYADESGDHSLASIDPEYPMFVVGGDNTFGRSLTDFEILFVDKRANSSGMQIADLTARPIGLSVLRPTQPNRSSEAIKQKILRLPSDRRGSTGIHVFP